MTHTSTEQPELRPCPFCGSHMISQSTGQTGDGQPWYYIECEECAATADPAYWNRRAPASQAQRVPLALYQRDTIKANAWRETVTGGYWDVNDIIDATEAAHGITQEKQG